MTRTIARLRRFAHDRDGATAIEYGLIVALLSMVVVVAVTTTGQGLYTTMNNVAGRISSAH